MKTWMRDKHGGTVLQRRRKTNQPCQLRLVHLSMNCDLFLPLMLRSQKFYYLPVRKIVMILAGLQEFHREEAESVEALTVKTSWSRTCNLQTVRCATFDDESLVCKSCPHPQKSGRVYAKSLKPLLYYNIDATGALDQNTSMQGTPVTNNGRVLKHNNCIVPQVHSSESWPHWQT